MQFISDSIFEISGYPPSDFIGNSVRTYESIILPVDTQMVDKKILDAIERKEPFEMEYRIVNADGAIRWVYEKGRGVYGDNGQVLWLDGAIFDITERKQNELGLKKHHENLEELVDDRTSELNTSNEKLMHEIANRKRKEEALRKSEERYRELVQNANSIILRWIPDGTITFFNKFAQKFFGFDASEIIGKNVIGSIVPEKESTGRDLKQMVADILKHPAKYEQNESENICKDGKRVWVSWSNRAIQDQNGNILEILTVGTDITDRKQSEDALRESEMINRSLLEGAPVCNKIIDLDFKLQYMSSAGIKRLRIPDIKSFYGQDYPLKFFCEETRITITENLKIALTGEISQVECLTHDTECNELWFVHTFVPVFDGAGRVKYIIGSSVDITDRKQAEADQRSSHQKFQSMVDNIGIGVALISPEMEIIEQNQKMHEWFPDVDLGMHPVCYKVFNDPPLDKACDHCPTAKTLMDGRVHESLTVTPSAGGERNFRIISTPIKNEKGQVTAAIEMVEDVTEKIKDETRLQQAQKLEAIGTLAGGIAHDFNNILGGILGYTELSKDDLPENSQADDYLNNVLTLTKRASDLVAQILTFSRQTVDIKKPGNIVPVLKESIKLLRATLPATIEIKQNIEESPAVVLSDPSSIHQIVMNLMTNASHSMENNTGIITIKFTSERLDEKDLEENRSLSPGIFVKLTVQDNGSGIDPSVINHIFDPFYTTKDVGKGTGLGLSVVHGIVTSHGGMIKVKSLPKKGTTFDVFLPKTEMKEEDVEAVFSQLFPGTGNIMFVDDEEILTNIAQRVLLSLGYTVTVSNSPLEAIEIFKKDPEQFDLVITDQSMPKMTGFDMAKRLMKLRPEIPVILCSGYNEEVTDQNIKDAGIRAYLMKPMTKAALSKVIFDVLNEKKN